MAPARIAGCPNDLELERVLWGETTAAREHALGCSHCAPRLAWMREVGLHFKASVYPRLSTTVIDAAVRSPSWLSWKLVLAASPIAAALIAFALVRSPGRDYIGSKGDGEPVLEVYAGDRAGGRRLLPGDHVHPGDGLRFLVSGRRRDVFIFTVDITGRVSRLYPAQGEAPIAAAGLLPGGAILDEVVGPERIFAVFPDRAMSFSDVEAVAAGTFRGATPESLRTIDRLPLDVPQGSLLLEKEQR